MNELLLKSPKVDELLRDSALAEALGSYGNRVVTEAIRTELDALRLEILAHRMNALPERAALCRQIIQRLHKESLPSFRTVINGTGIILHTNAVGGLGFAAYDAGKEWAAKHGDDMV